jgi:thioredoxin-like negative regulator of GroEL
MGSMRNGNDAGSPEALETDSPLPAGEPLSDKGTDVPDMVERHRQAAIRLLKEGQAARAFGELVRSSRALPMTPRLAAELVACSLRAGTEAAAVALLSSALEHTQGETRRAVRLQLARQLRRANQLPGALEVLQALVAEVPGDRHARRLIDTIFRRVAGEAPPSTSSGSLAAPVVRGERFVEDPKPPQPWEEDELLAESAHPLDARFKSRAPR